MAGIDPALEEQIRERWAAGDAEGAATATLRGYGPQILGYLSALLRDPGRADDAFSTFSEDLWKGLPGFRGACSFRTWVYKLAWHAAARTAREGGARRNVPLSAVSEIAEEVRSATAPHLRTEVKSAVQKLREHLTADEQTLLILRVDRGLAWNDVAEVMDVDAASARKRFERIKERLTELARAQGIVDS
jgi:RNA polymerase sigma-70 factor, ECF subfamily